MPTNTIQQFLLGIPEKEIKILSHWITEEKHAEILNLKIRRTGKTAVCPFCSKRTSKRKELGVIVKRRVKHTFTTHGKEVLLYLEKRRFRHCDKSFYETYSFEGNGWHTLAFENYILSEWRHLSVLELSRRTGVSDFKLWKIIKSIDTEKLAKIGIDYLESLEEIHLGLDGHSFRGRDMVYVITEVKTHKVIAILEKETNDCIRDWLNSLPPGVLKKIKSFVIDMKIGIKYTIQQTIGGNVIEVVDHYHVVQEANKVVDEVRRLGNWLRREVKREMRTILSRAKKDERKVLEHILKNGEIQSYVEIKQRLIFLKAAERLTPKQQEFISTLLKRCKYLREAWLNKELLRESLQNKDEELLRKVREDCLASDQYRIRQFGRTLKRWFQAILNFFKLNITNAFTEGKNNKAKVFKRIAYGYRNKDSYIRRLYFSL
jgi:transposase